MNQQKAYIDHINNT